MFEPQKFPSGSLSSYYSPCWHPGLPVRKAGRPSCCSHVTHLHPLTPMWWACWKALLFRIHFWTRPKSHSVAESPLAAQGGPWILNYSASPGIAREVGESLMSRENSHTPSYPEHFLQNVSWVAFNWTIYLLVLRKEMHPNSWQLAVPPDLSKEHGAPWPPSLNQWSIWVVSQSLKSPRPCLLGEQQGLGEGLKWGEPM